MSTNSIPTASHPIAGGQRVDATWYRWLRELERLADKAGVDFSAEIEALCRKLGSPDGTIDGIPDPEPPALVGESPVSVNGPVIGLETVPVAAGGTPQAITVDAYGRVTQRRPIEPEELPEDFRVWLTDETGAYLTDDLGNYLCDAGYQFAEAATFLGSFNIETNVNFNFRALTATGFAGFNLGGINAFGFDGTAPFAGATINFRAAETWSGTQAGSDIQFRANNYGTRTLLERFRIRGNGEIVPGSDNAQALGTSLLRWSVGHFATLNLGGSLTANIQAGTIEGQLARWNNTAGRYEPVTAAGLVNAANDAAAAGAGVPVSGIYRNGSVLQIRVA